MSLLPRNKLAWRHHFPIISLWNIFFKFFKHSRATYCAISFRIWPKLELVQDFMHVFVTCKFKEDQINSNRENVETSIFKCSWAANSIISGPIWPKFELMQDIMYVYVTSNFKKDRINTNREKVETLMF